MKSQLGRNTMSEKILRRLWLDKLPPSATQILAPMIDTTPIDMLANSADRILESNSSPQTVNALATPSSQNNELQQLKAEMGELKAMIKALQTQSREPRGRSQSLGRQRRSRSRERSPYSQPQGGICWYHYKFGNNARKCNSPCNYKPQGNANPSQ